MRRNQNAIGLMRAITDYAPQPSGSFSPYALRGIWARVTAWSPDPHATTQTAVLEMSDGTWLTVTVEQHQEKPA